MLNDVNGLAGLANPSALSEPVVPSGLSKKRLVSTGPRSRKQVLIYVNQIYSDDPSGQGSFERGLTTALQDLAQSSAERQIRIITVRRPGAAAATVPPQGIAHCLPLSKSSYRGYLALQARQLLALVRELLRWRAEHAAIWVRYNDTMVAPAMAAMIANRCMVIRAPAVLPELVAHKSAGLALQSAVKMSVWMHTRVARFVVTEAVENQQWLERTFPFLRGRVRVMENAVNVRLFQPVPRNRQAWGLPEDEHVLGYTGSVDPIHDLATVIRSIARLKEITSQPPHLLVVGTGSSIEIYRSLAESLGISGLIHWAGPRPQSEIPAAIAACDVMLLPLIGSFIRSVGFSSLKLYEYIACDKPVIAVRCPAHNLVVEHGVGWFAEADDVESWARQIGIACRSSANQQSGRIRQIALNNYSFDNYAEKVWHLCFDEPGHFA